MYYEKDINVMKAFFEGRVKNEIPKHKVVELGHGKGIGHVQSSYNQYIKALSEQRIKGNGFISIGKSVIEKDIFSMPNPTDEFVIGDVPKLLITYGNIINDILLKVAWKDSNDDIILEEYYEIPSAYSMGNSWWDSYGVLFIGPEELEEGDYKVEIISEEMISKEYTMREKKDNIKSFSTSLGFSIENQSDQSD
jgi:hypothetical protein